MILISKRFSTFQRLKAVANNQALIKFGETGSAVKALQLAFLSLKFPMPNSTKHYSCEPDGIFGSETLATVKACQAKHGLWQDGIVGRQTLSMLDELFSPVAVPGNSTACGNCLGPVGPFHPPGMIQAALGASSESGAGKAKFPTNLRLLTSAERKKAQTVFGNSLDFSIILISNGLGLNGRAFVTVRPYIIPLRPSPKETIVSWGSSPSDATFFHELAHVWQAQHHFNSRAFMVNALASQAAAEAVDGSAYAFIPGRNFSRYGAEQIAQQVQRGKVDIISQMRAVRMYAPHPGNLPFPWLPYWETPGAPDVES